MFTLPAETIAWPVARQFDVYLVDAGMPGESAVAICRTIRNVDRDGVVICLSAEETDSEKLLAAEADYFIKIPDGLGRIRQTIDNLLDNAP